MITKKDLRNMPFYQPFYGPAEAPPNVRWDIFWAHTCESCDLEPFSRLDWDIVSHPEGGGGYPEPEVDHEAQDQASEDGEQFPAGGYDDDDACLAALNEGFTLVRVPYGEPGEGWDRILVCARKDNPNPKYARDVTAKKLEYRAKAKPLDSSPPRYDRLEGGQLIEVKTRGSGIGFLDHLKAILEAVQLPDKPVTVDVVHTATRIAVEANMADPHAGGPTIAIIEMNAQLQQAIFRHKRQFDQLAANGGDIFSLQYRDGSCSFWSELEDDFTADQQDEITDGGLDLPVAYEPNPDCEASIENPRLVITQYGFLWEADRRYDACGVQSTLMNYEWLEKLEF